MNQTVFVMEIDILYNILYPTIIPTTKKHYFTLIFIVGGLHMDLEPGKASSHN